MVESAVTRVIHLGEDVGGSSLRFIAEIDADMHQDADGEVQSVFLSGDEVYVLLHHDPALKVVRVIDTADGDLQRIGKVSRTRTVRLVFPAADEVLELPHLPDAMPSAIWYGRTGRLLRDGLNLRAVGAPCVGDISYSFSAIQYRYRLPSTISLAAGEKFPVELVMEVEE